MLYSTDRVNVNKEAMIMIDSMTILLKKGLLEKKIYEVCMEKINQIYGVKAPQYLRVQKYEFLYQHLILNIKVKNSQVFTIHKILSPLLLS